MNELVLHADKLFRKFAWCRMAYELLSLGKCVAEFFQAVWLEVHRGADLPQGETLTGDAGAFQNALLCRTQLIELELEHLLECLWYTKINASQWLGQTPHILALCEDPFFF